MIRTKRLRKDPVEAADGTRVYVGRYYPRGLRSPPPFAERDPGLGPSRELHRAVTGGAIGVGEYRRRYLREMAAPEAKAKVAALAARSAGGETITLLCDHPASLPDEECHRHLLADLVRRAERRLTRRGRG